MRLIWINMINAVIDRYTGGETRPVSYDVAATYPTLDGLTRGFADIQREFLALLPQKDNIPRYHEIDGGQKYISATIDADRSWRTYMLRSVMSDNASNMARCPRTAELLSAVPNVINAFFSILDPGKSIPAHEGGYRGILRYHLGLLVPQVDPPSIRVKDVVHEWKEGQPFLFDDSWNHEVYNRSSSVRAILCVDVLRPLPVLPHALNAGALWWMSRSKLYGKVNDAIEREARKMKH